MYWISTEYNFVLNCTIVRKIVQFYIELYELILLVIELYIQLYKEYYSLYIVYKCITIYTCKVLYFV